MTSERAKALMKYSIKAVRDELECPAHGRLSHYDRDAVMIDVLNHFDWLTNSDDDYDLIQDYVRDAELIVDPDGGL